MLNQEGVLVLGVSRSKREFWIVPTVVLPSGVCVIQKSYQVVPN